MIGKNQILMRSLVQYFYQGGDTEEAAAPEFQPPTGGCYVRCDVGAGGDGSVTVTGTYGGEDAEDTITSFDSEGIGIGTQKFNTITSVEVTLTEGTDSITIYPADDMGNTINYSTYTSSYIRGDWSYSSKTSSNRLVVNVGGEKIESDIELMFNKNFNIKRDDTLSIDGFWYKVELVQSFSRSVKIAYLTNTGEVAT